MESVDRWSVCRSVGRSVGRGLKEENEATREDETERRKEGRKERRMRRRGKCKQSLGDGQRARQAGTQRRVSSESATLFLPASCIRCSPVVDYYFIIRFTSYRLQGVELSLAFSLRKLCERGQEIRKRS